MGPNSKNCMMIVDFYREPNIWVAWVCDRYRNSLYILFTVKFFYSNFAQEHESSVIHQKFILKIHFL